MTSKTRRNDSQATKDFWTKVNQQDRIADAAGKGIDLNNMAEVVAHWNELTTAERAEAQALCAEAAAIRYTEVTVNRALGLDWDYPNGEFVKVR